MILVNMRSTPAAYVVQHRTHLPRLFDSQSRNGKARGNCRYRLVLFRLDVGNEELATEYGGILLTPKGCGYYPASMLECTRIPCNTGSNRQERCDGP